MFVATVSTIRQRMDQENQAGDHTPKPASLLESSFPLSAPQEPLSYRPLVLTKGKLEYLWDNMRRYPQVFDDVIPRTFEAFKEGMMAPSNQFYEFTRGEEIIGLAAATQVRVRLDANMHLVMFDRRLRGRESIIRAAMADFMKRAQLRR